MIPDDVSLVHSWHATNVTCHMSILIGKVVVLSRLKLSVNVRSPCSSTNGGYLASFDHFQTVPGLLDSSSSCSPLNHSLHYATVKPLTNRPTPIINPCRSKLHKRHLSPTSPRPGNSCRVLSSLTLSSWLSVLPWRTGLGCLSWLSSYLYCTIRADLLL